MPTRGHLVAWRPSPSLPSFGDATPPLSVNQLRYSFPNSSDTAFSARREGLIETVMTLASYGSIADSNQFYVNY